MTESQNKEFDAFLAFFTTFDLHRSVTTAADLSDGATLLEILSTIDAEYFHQPSRTPHEPSENWVLRFNAVKRVYRLMTQYFSDVLGQLTDALEVPDLQALAKDHNISSILLMCRLTLAIAVQCDKNKEFIEKIQRLSEANQHHLMKAIEQVPLNVFNSPPLLDILAFRDDHYYQLQSGRSRILSEKEALEKVYQALLEEHRALQSHLDDVISERDDAFARSRQLVEQAHSRRSDKADAIMKAEIDRLRAELQKSEENLAVAESELEKQTSVVVELTHRVDESQGYADEAARLKDQVDELRHASDRLAKTENVMEKYKKKLQEGADLRQHVKSLEKQNADLVDKNASLEEEYRKVAAYKPLMESYKNQIADLESKAASRSKAYETALFELEQTRTKLRITEEERAKDSEALELYQERVRELELSSHRPMTSDQSKRQSSQSAEPGVLDQGDEDEDLSKRLVGELDDALAGTTMTDLKLQVRRLNRELHDLRTNQLDSSKVLVLENLLDDANRMKSRYEADYLAAHREKLVLQNELEEIRNGKALGDGPEAAIALRQRLNETIDELDNLRKEHTELEVQHNAIIKELTIVKSDLALVNRDQLDILASLRESVNDDKVALEQEVFRLQEQLREAAEKIKMQLEQINSLLLEKVNLQSEGIGQREKMLQRERDFGDLRASVSGKGIPEEVKSRVLGLHEDNVQLREHLKTAQDKLTKARGFIKSQDKLFKEEQAKIRGFTPSSVLDETDSRSQVRILEDEVKRYQRLLGEAHQRYRKEQELLLSAIHTIGMHTARDPFGRSYQQTRALPTSWLGQQRQNVSLVMRGSVMFLLN
ncbi:HOOK protein-domain-containing protein [Multifurca ochricompacta]|uniref:HOOK protein-domain-containing protein n=1 Tax=Multifurca ochricompacta TaxID=376703 RepID=A0AAD4MCR2_9AGAM|nr:HOOK protein-domain-containing protein [Multifurca ochricompacta]